MRYLFLGPGYPSVDGAGSGSGIGTYLREIALGLTARGHECHVLVWGEPRRPQEHCVEGVTVHVQPRGYWHVLERFWPESRNVYSRAKAAAALHARHRFDWMEIQSDEGIDIGVQRRFPAITVLRVHTTLAQMVEHKHVAVTPTVERNLARERRSLLMAPRVITHSALHATKLRARFPMHADVQIVHHGIDMPAGDANAESASPGSPRFLLVGTPDRRKGFDRLRPVLECYLRRYGPCRAEIISAAAPEFRAAMRLDGPLPQGLEVTWRSGLSAAELAGAYRGSAALLHLARYESFGLPLIEAALLGTPVVTTGVGIAPELLTGKLARFLIDGDAPEACAAALAAAAAKRTSVGTALAQIARERFSRQAMVGRFLQVLATWRGAPVGPELGGAASVDDPRGAGCGTAASR